MKVKMLYTLGVNGYVTQNLIVFIGLSHKFSEITMKNTVSVSGYTTLALCSWLSLESSDLPRIIGVKNKGLNIEIGSKGYVIRILTLTHLWRRGKG